MDFTVTRRDFLSQKIEFMLQNKLSFEKKGKKDNSCHKKRIHVTWRFFFIWLDFLLHKNFPASVKRNSGKKKKYLLHRNNISNTWFKFDFYDKNKILGQEHNSCCRKKVLVIWMKFRAQQEMSLDSNKFEKSL